MAECRFNSLYRNGDYFVLKEDDRFVVCDVDGCSAELMHVGDDYGTLDEAKVMVDFWENGGHWMDRPDSNSLKEKEK